MTVQQYEREANVAFDLHGCNHSNGQKKHRLVAAIYVAHTKTITFVVLDIHDDGRGHIVVWLLTCEENRSHQVIGVSLLCSLYYPCHVFLKTFKRNLV